LEGGVTDINFRVQAQKILEMKGISYTQGDLNEYIRHLTFAYQRIYRAVALDVDGTLTADLSAELSTQLIRIVTGLLRRGVPVLLVTGRGKTTTIGAARQLRAAANLSSWYFRRLRCACYEGAVYLSTHRERPSEFLGLSTVTIQNSDGYSLALKELYATLNSTYKAKDINIELHPTTESTKLVLRCVTSSEAKCQELVNALNPLIAKGRCALNITYGRWGNKHSVSVTSGSKRLALHHFAKDIGIDESRILRVGDQGQRGGNDFDMLDHASGFSVDQISKIKFKCHPVLSIGGDRKLSGAEATSTLLGQLNILPPISIDIRNSAELRASFRAFEAIALARARQEGHYLQERLRYKLKCIIPQMSLGIFGGAIDLADIFDEKSGAVLFREWEIDEIRTNISMATLFEFDLLINIDANSRGPQYCMYTDSSIIARGPNYYYSMTRDESRCGVREFLAIASRFIEQSRDVIKNINPAELTFVTFKLLLAIIDNIRNHILLIQNILFVHAQNTNDGRYSDLVKSFLEHCVVEFTDVHYGLLFNEDERFASIRARLLSAIDKISTNVTTIQMDNLIGNLTGKEYLRQWRETDFFIQNATAVGLGLRELVDQGELGEEQPDNPWAAIGLMYGGLELAALAAVIGKRRGIQICPGLVHVSTYHSKSAAKNIRAGEAAYLRELENDRPLFLCDSSKGRRPMLIEGIRGRKTIILDDNCTTGVTLQMARDLLAFRGADVAGAIIVRFPGSNRHVHMAIPGRGFPDPEMMFSFVRGLVAPSPYTRLLFPRRKDGERFLDQTGMFDKARDRIERYLLKNNTPPVEINGRSRK
jgi:hydroxymethylpyrimidine pyrophosphatase-like HAD family hydrolase